MSASGATSAAIEVAAGLIVRDGRVLVCQRSFSGTHPGRFEFPGGKREPGESIRDCLRRELREELGVDAEIGRELWRCRHEYPGQRPVELVFLSVAGFTGEPVNHVFASMHWSTMSELAGLDFLEGDRGFIDLVVAGQLDLGASPSRE